MKGFIAPPDIQRPPDAGFGNALSPGRGTGAASRASSAARSATGGRTGDRNGRGGFDWGDAPVSGRRRSLDLNWGSDADSGSGSGSDVAGHGGRRGKGGLGGGDKGKKKGKKGKLDKRRKRGSGASSSESHAGGGGGGGGGGRGRRSKAGRGGSDAEGTGVGSSGEACTTLITLTVDSDGDGAEKTRRLGPDGKAADGDGANGAPGRRSRNGKGRSGRGSRTGGAEGSRSKYETISEVNADGTDDEDARALGPNGEGEGDGLGPEGRDQLYLQRGDGAMEVSWYGGNVQGHLLYSGYSHYNPPPSAGTLRRRQQSGGARSAKRVRNPPSPEPLSENELRWSRLKRHFHNKKSSLVANALPGGGKAYLTGRPKPRQTSRSGATEASAESGSNHLPALVGDASKSPWDRATPEKSKLLGLTGSSAAGLNSARDFELTIGMGDGINGVHGLRMHNPSPGSATLKSAAEHSRVGDVESGGPPTPRSFMLKVIDEDGRPLTRNLAEGAPGAPGLLRGSRELGPVTPPPHIRSPRGSIGEISVGSMRPFGNELTYGVDLTSTTRNTFPLIKNQKTRVVVSDVARYPDFDDDSD